MTSRSTNGEKVCKIPRERKAVDEAIRFAELATSSCDQASREAAVLAVSELTENVLKYAAPDQHTDAGTIIIGVHGKTMRIRARNVASSRKDAESVMAVVSQISANPNVSDLYRRRLRELFQKSDTSRAQLGLLRLAFEGGFSLSCSYDARVLEIVAERPCDETR